jgi:hypothetical protein
MAGQACFALINIKAAVDRRIECKPDQRGTVVTIGM